MSGRWSVRLLAFAALLVLLGAVEVVGQVAPGMRQALPWLRLAWLAVLSAGGVAWLEQNRRTTLRGLRSIGDLIRRSNHPVDVQAILDAALTRCVLLLGADGGCMRLLKPDGTLVVAASMNVHPGHLGKRRRVHKSHESCQVWISGPDPVFLQGAAAEAELPSFFGTEPVRAAIITPLVAGADTHGVLALAFRKPHRLSLLAMEALRIIGLQLGVAIANAARHDLAVRESRTDPLTGVGSRRLFDDRCRQELARARRNGRPLSLAMVDVDHLKMINDRYGHVTGDAVLKALGELMSQVRAGDVVARYGGDEFVILMPDTRRADAEQVIERLGRRLDALNDSRQFPFPINISIGVREMENPDRDLLADADAAMYEEKRRHALAQEPRSDTEDECGIRDRSQTG